MTGEAIPGNGFKIPHVDSKFHEKNPLVRALEGNVLIYSCLN